MLSKRPLCAYGPPRLQGVLSRSAADQSATTYPASEVAARASLAERIAEYRPLTIVSLLRSIRKDVEIAAAMAGWSVEHINTPFPGMGWQDKFKDEMRYRWSSPDTEETPGVRTLVQPTLAARSEFRMLDRMVT